MNLVKIFLSDGRYIYAKCDDENPFGKRCVVDIKGEKKWGVVVSPCKAKYAEFFYARTIDEIPVVTPSLLKLAEEVSKNYLAPLFDVLSLCSPPGQKPSFKVSLKDPSSALFPMKKEGLLPLWEYLKSKKNMSASFKYIVKKFKIRADKLRSLIERGFLIADLDCGRSFRSNGNDTQDRVVSTEIQMTDDQSEAFNKIKQSFGSFNVFLVFGVTGSGKTELYIRLADAMLKSGRNVIIMMPEIALATYLLERFESRLGRVAVLHSGLSPSKRNMFWWSLRMGNHRVVIGARSAVFAPLENVGLIIVDEEHDSSYKQLLDSHQSVPYNARDCAVMRGRIENSTVVLGSATPSFESFLNVERGIYKICRLDKRVRGLSLPKVEVVDMRKEEVVDFLSVPISLKLKNYIEEALNRKKQVILLHNRRGFSSVVVCTSCGKSMKCFFCSSNMVYHSTEGGEGYLLCHWCGDERRVPLQCLNCSASSDNFDFLGIGTQRLEEELSSIFDAKIFRMDSDVVSSASAAREVFNAFSKTKPSILLGTQMVAKGLDFPDVSVVGVILADDMFGLPDFRASEKSYQMLMQVTGRAGRGAESKQSISVIQTYDPDHPVVRMQGEWEKFYRYEIGSRKERLFPPFSRIVFCSFSSEDQEEAFNSALFFLRKVKDKGLEVMGPVKSARFKISGRYHFNFIIKGNFDIAETINRIFTKCVLWRGNTKIAIDIDPVSIF